MATVSRITYVCDNCDKTLDESSDQAHHFTLTYDNVSNTVDLCSMCAEKVAWLHAKGTRVEGPRKRATRVVRPEGTPAPRRGRPRKAVAPLGTGTDTGPLPEPVVEVAGARVVTLGEMFGEAGETVASTDLSDDGMGGNPVVSSTPMHPAFTAAPTP